MRQVSSSASSVHSWSGLGIETHAGRSSVLESDPFGNHRITATGHDDLIRAREESLGGLRWLVVDVNDDRYRIPLTGPRAARSVAIDAGAGNDAVFVDPSVMFPLFIQGGVGDDYLKGGSGPAALLGGEGSDTLIGGPASNDLLLGGGDNDVIHTGGGRDMVSMGDLLQRLREGWCDRPVIAPERPSEAPSWTLPAQELPPVASQPQPPSQPQPVIAPVPPPIVRPQPQVQRPVVPRSQKPFVAPRPRLSDLLAAVDTHNEKGFKSGRSMTKNLLTALYDGPQRFREAVASLAGQGERDDAVASFLRALFDAGPGGARLFKDIPLSEKKTLAAYLGGGNSWNAQKKGLMLVMSKATGAPDRNFGNDSQAQDYLRRYAGVF
ncbi:MAG TPA: calcium-binding protein [bacterium]|nr:calcium-binding protein [bacterium]